MKTINTAELQDAIGPYARSLDNPFGVYFYFDSTPTLPWRIADNEFDEGAATYEELIELAQGWRETLDAAKPKQAVDDGWSVLSREVAEELERRELEEWAATL